jgi:hypothetical protein
MFNTSSYDDNPWRILAFVIGVGVIVTVIIFLNISKAVKNSKAFNSGEIKIKKSNPEEESFYKYAEGYQLRKDEIKFLWNLLRSGRGDPGEIFTDKNTLDSTFKTHYQQMWKESERSKSTLKDLVQLFEIRNCIAYFQNVTPDRGRTIRRYIRKEASFSCNCILVNEVKTKKGSKMLKSLVLTNTAFAGTVLDLSAGGCAFTATANIKAGAMLKIDTTTGKDRKASALGEVIRVNKSAGTIIFHIRFLKIMPKSICIISAYIFGYDTK